MQNKGDYPAFHEFMRGVNPDEWMVRLLTQSIARLSVTEEYADMTPEQVYGKVVETAEAVYETPPV